MEYLNKLIQSDEFNKDVLIFIILIVVMVFVFSLLDKKK